jgi:L-ribulokinase
VPGIQGVVEDGILPGFFGYEAGQAAFGDTFDWLVERMLGTPRGEQGRVHAQLSREAAALRGGQSGLLVLDWWNGNRSVLVEPRLSGLIVGLTRATRPAQLYRALIEGAAFSTRKIVENFVAHGVAVDELLCCGGIAEKNELVLQVLADVTGRPVVRVDSGEVCAIGAAIFGAVAAGAAGRGHASVRVAIESMAAKGRRTIAPRREEAAKYERLYRRWERLHDHFGRLGGAAAAAARHRSGSGSVAAATDPDDVMLFLRELQDAD